jgi:hypothetical protein
VSTHTDLREKLIETVAPLLTRDVGRATLKRAQTIVDAVFARIVAIRPAEGITAIYEVAKLMDADLSMTSWSGFNIAGDRKSIDEVRRLMHAAARVEALEKEVERLQNRVVA